MTPSPTPPTLADQADPPLPLAPRLQATHIPALDGVRGLAILLVLAFHTYHVSPQGLGLIGKLLRCGGRMGWSGVDLFFVLSGFLITGILWEARGSAHYFRSFYGRRVLRIFPIYYAFLVVVLIVVQLLGDRAWSDLRVVHDHQFWYWTHLTNLARIPFGVDGVYGRLTGHFWSLAMEEQFYFLWPMIVYRASRKTLMRLCVAAVLASLGLRVLLVFLKVHWSQVFIFTPAHLDSLLAGAFVALFLEGRPCRPLDLRRARGLVLLTGAALAIMIAAVTGPEQGHFVMATVGLTLLALFFGGIVFLAAAMPPGGLLHSLLGHGLLRTFGKYSYGIYVLHPLAVRLAWQPVADTLRRLPLGDPSHTLYAGAYTLVMVLVCLLPALVSYQLYEKHFLRLKRLLPYA